MGFGIFWIEEGGEAYVGLGFRNVIPGDAGQSATKEEAGIAGMFFDDLGDGFLRFGKVLVENGLLGGGDGRIKEGIFVGPLGELTNIEKAAFLMGGIPQGGEGGVGDCFRAGGGGAGEEGERSAGGQAHNLVLGIENRGT